MVEQSTINAAIISGIISGVVSLLVNGFSIVSQYFIDKKRKQRNDREHWYRKLISEVNEIRRKAIEIGPDTEFQILEDGSIEGTAEGNELDIISDLIKSIEGRQDRIPPELKGSQVDSELSNLISSYKDIGTNHEDADIFTVKGSLQQQSEDVLDAIEQNYKRAEDLY